MATPPAETKSCLGCPSFTNSNEQRISPGRAIGAPICAIKMIPLARPGGDEKKTGEYFAKGCNSYGKEVTLKPELKSEKTPIYYQIAMPNAAAEPFEVGVGDSAVSSCNQCANYIPTQVTRKLTGYSGGYCRAKGSVILDDRLAQNAAGCTDKVFQPAGERMDEMNLSSGSNITIMILPEYDVHFGRKKPVDIEKIHTLNMQVKPADWPTAREVKPGHRARGIKAFRLIQDPANYGPDLVLPIMDEFGVDRDGNQIFSDEDRKRIPRSGDGERPERYYDHGGFVYKVAVMWTKLGQTPAAWGEAGVGKTELFRHVAWLMNMPFQRISFTSSSEVDDMIGKMMYSPEKGTYFQYGRLVRASLLPNVLCLDEPNTAEPALWQQIRPLTDDSKQLVVDQNGGERLALNKLCYMGMAMNPAWDIRNSGVAPLADADGSRLMHVKMELPPEKIEKQILREVLELDGWEEAEANIQIDPLMRIAKELRELSSSGEAPFTWGLRNQKKVLRMRRFASWPDAFRMGVTDSLEPQVAETILRVVTSHAPTESR